MSEQLKNSDPVSLEFVYNYFQKFMALSRTEVEGLMQYCEFRKFSKKEIIVQEGETDNYLNMVVQGLVRKFIRVKKNEVILQLATEGHVIHSEISYLTRTPSLVVLETLEPTVLVSISYKNMEEALEKYPQGEKLGRLILTGMYIKKDERRFTELSKTVRERFLDYVTHHPHMLQRVPQKYLATYLNIKPETFSRLKHLIKQKK
jgi:CRP-like cAMP-binding protein